MEHAAQVIVKNYGRARDFAQLEDSGVPQKLADSAARWFQSPELDATAMYKIDRYGLSYWAASHSGDGEPHLGPLERRRVQVWLDACFQGFDAALS